MIMVWLSTKRLLNFGAESVEPLLTIGEPEAPAFDFSCNFSSDGTWRTRKLHIEPRGVLGTANSALKR